MTRVFLCLFAALFALAGCGETISSGGGDARILAMGDSMLAWHSSSNRSISDEIERDLGEPVVDRSVVGARMIYELPVSGAMGMNISKQYKPGAWDWVIVNGGGNDLWLGCNCSRCDHKMDKMISKDGSSGEIPALVRKVRATGARVVYLGYLRSPGMGSPIEHCRDEGDELDRRLTAMARGDEGVTFVSLAKLVPYGDHSYHALDMVHPSMKASAKIGAMVAQIIQNKPL